MTRYQSGRVVEWKVRDMLLSAGASIVVRSAGSKTLADLVAMFKDSTWAIQCKRAKPSTAEVEGVRYQSRFTEAGWAIVWWQHAECEVQCFRNGRPTIARWE